MADNESLEDFKNKLKDAKDKLINFHKKPEPEIKKKKRSPMTSAEAKAKSGWRRGLALGGSIR